MLSISCFISVRRVNLARDKPTPQARLPVPLRVSRPHRCFLFDESRAWFKFGPGPPRFLFVLGSAVLRGMPEPAGGGVAGPGRLGPGLERRGLRGRPRGAVRAMGGGQVRPKVTPFLLLTFKGRLPKALPCPPVLFMRTRVKFSRTSSQRLPLALPPPPPLIWLVPGSTSGRTPQTLPRGGEVGGAWPAVPTVASPRVKSLPTAAFLLLAPLPVCPLTAPPPTAAAVETGR